MTTKRFILLTLISALIALLSLSAVYAQDATATPDSTDTEQDTDDSQSDDTEATEQGTDNQQDNQQGQTGTEGMVTCDSDLILMLYVAERFFNFNTFAGQMSSQMNFDIATINRGQYAPWFNQMEQSSNMNNVQMSDEFNTAMMNMMTMSDADFETSMMAGADTSSMTMLNSHDVADEPQECAALRNTLRRFFTALAFNESQMGGVNFGDQTGTTGGTDTSDTDTDTGTGDTSGTDTGDTSGTGDTDAAVGAITVNLTGAEEVPGPGDTDASGTSTVYLRTNTNEVCVDISIDGGMILPATAAHIHQAPRGEAGPPVVPLNAPNENGLSSTCVVVDEALMQEMVNNPGNFYVNVHNEEFPDGAVRGQMTIGAPSSSGGTDTSGSTETSGSTNTDAAAGAIAVNLTGAEEVPGPGDTDASGTSTVYLRTNTNEVCVDISIDGGMVLPATAAHIHQAPRGEAGPPVVPLTAPNENGLSSTCVVVDAALMQEMVNNPGNFYVNVHNEEFPEGAVRGQLD